MQPKGWNTSKFSILKLPFIVDFDSRINPTDFNMGISWKPFSASRHDRSRSLVNKQRTPLMQYKSQSSSVQRRSKRVMAEEVKLFGAWGSPFSRRAELALRLKGISYDNIEEDLSNKSPFLLEYNPIHKKVPVLLHGGKPIVESLVILEYIEETWEGNHSMLPKDPYEKAMARFWARFIDEKCIPALWMSCWTQGDMQQTFMIQSKENLCILEEELKGKKFFGGNAIGLVDIAAMFLAHWVGVLQEVAGISLINEEKHPILFKWIEEFMSSDAVMECLPAREALLAFFQAKKEAFLAAKAPVY